LANLRFENLNIKAPFLKALEEEGYTSPTPIQNETIPFVLQGLDVLGMAQTGTGKTAAFTLPILQKLNASQSTEKARDPRALILAPTRELAIQINESIRKYGQYIALKHTVIFGGVKQGPQVKALDRGMDIIVATPGRLLDLINQGFCSLNKIEFFVLDEADRMLDMGFIRDVEKVVKILPKKRQTLFFSATMPDSVIKLANTILTSPKQVKVKSTLTPVERIAQSVIVIDPKDKVLQLITLLKEKEFNSVIVFTKTKHKANRINQKLTAVNIDSEAIHSNKSQAARQKALNGFKDGTIKILIATDIAARGIDVEAVSHIINFDMPSTPEDYVHRIGRTARAGASGIAVSFCEPSERLKLFRIEKLIDLKLEVVKSNLLNPENIIGYNEEINRSQSKPKHDANQFEDKKYKSKKLASIKGKSGLKRNAKKNKLLQNKKKIDKR
jgi:ATP-dependent RNA helicase RhlE|tara:strand:- start:1367 stop:2695 length:1329 start_codon:yes stop_codon:yes gene_type:complete